MASVEAVSCAASGGCTSGGAIDLWDAATGTPRRQILSSVAIASLVFSTDGKVLAGVSDDDEVHLWDTQTGHPRGTLRASSLLAFAPVGELLAVVRHDSNIELRNCKTGELLRTLHGKNEIAILKFSPQGDELLSVDAKNVVTLWRLV